MNLKQYIVFWDQEIKKLLSSRSSFTSYPMSLGIGEPPLQGDFIPEPFMGNPDEFSFVIVNLNPGPAAPHSCIRHKNTPGMFVNKVEVEGYSTAVSSFPYLRDCPYSYNGKNVNLIDWNNSPGRKWWKEKERWIKHKIKLFDSSYDGQDPIPNDLLPFAMEMYAWHTCKWPKSLNNKMKKSGTYGKVVKDNVIDPLYEAIQNSKFKTAFCVGKPIGEIIDSFGVFKIKKHHVITKKTKRHYDVYEDGKGNRIINTWAQGGNKFPSGDFETAEASII